ncbi:hypothetical protein ACSYAD_12790 [Acaryochloris marina NIES-2412]|uniref:hypothetical protein n=1 Tax=Acaryochloris marina TaxID=155978 RepID=UPI004059836C
MRYERVDEVKMTGCRSLSVRPGGPLLIKAVFAKVLMHKNPQSGINPSDGVAWPSTIDTREIDKSRAHDPLRFASELITNNVIVIQDNTAAHAPDSLAWQRESLTEPELLFLKSHRGWQLLESYVEILDYSDPG